MRIRLLEHKIAPGRRIASKIKTDSRFELGMLNRLRATSFFVIPEFLALQKYPESRFTL